MREHTRASAFDPTGLPVWAQVQARRALELLPDGMVIANARLASSTSYNLTIADGSGEQIGQLVILPAGVAADPAEPLANLHVKQIAVRNGKDLIWVTLGKLLDPQLAGRSNRLVVRIEKNGGYEVVTVSRGTGRPVRYKYGEDLIAAVRLSLDS